MGKSVATGGPVSSPDARFDVVVIGGGHAGIEASVAAAKLGAAVVLVLPNPDKIGLMPCNPAIGGARQVADRLRAARPGRCHGGTG